MKEAKDIRILLGCEESQAVCIEFRKLGFEAFSCDLQECSGNHPEWHYQKDIFEVIEMGWDCMIAFPPCTHLAVSGAAWFEQKRKDGRQQQGIDFFLKIANVNIKHIAIENPIGIMSKIYRKPNQIIHPYYFGDAEPKQTCLWLKNLPHLLHKKAPDLFGNDTTHVLPKWHIAKSGKKYSSIHLGCGAMFDGEKMAKLRSKTFPGIAKAMATQWGEYLLTPTRSTLSMGDIKSVT